MPKLFNVDHQHALIDPLNYVSVAPGDSHEFTDDEIAAGIAGCWSEVDPRAGLDAEREFKQRRDRGKQSAQADDTTTEPAEPESKE